VREKRIEKKSDGEDLYGGGGWGLSKHFLKKTEDQEGDGRRRNREHKEVTVDTASQASKKKGKKKSLNAS